MKKSILEFVKKPIFHLKKKVIIGIAVTTLTLITSGIGAYAYAAPYSFVSLDVNPSIQYTLNRFNRVIKIEAVNDDGQKILNEISDVKNLSIKTAIRKTIAVITKEGYFDVTNTANETDSKVTDSKEVDTKEINVNGTEANRTDADEINTDVSEKDSGNNLLETSGIIITVSNEDQKQSEDLSDDLQITVDHSVKDNVEVEVTSIGMNRVKEAAKLGISPGKLHLIEKLKASSTNPDSIHITDWANQPVKDIMHAIKVNKKSSKDAAVTANKIKNDSDTEDNNSADDQSKIENDNNDNVSEINESKSEVSQKSSLKASVKSNITNEKAAEKTKKKQQKTQRKSDKNDMKTNEKSSKYDKEKDDNKIENEDTDNDNNDELNEANEDKNDEAKEYQKQYKNGNKHYNVSNSESEDDED